MSRLLVLLSLAAGTLPVACAGSHAGHVTGEDAAEGEDVGMEQAEESSDLEGNQIDQDPTFDDPALP